MKRVFFRITLVIVSISITGLAAYVSLPALGRRKPLVVPIRTDQITVPADTALRHFYTYKTHQTLIYTAPWQNGEIEQRTNADGLVDRYDYDIPKKNGVIRILALGDSFTQGVLVRTEESYPEVLEDMLLRDASAGASIEVLNFGVGGYDAEYAAYKLRRQGMKYEPDIVVWLLKFDDFFLVNERNAGVRGSVQDEFTNVHLSLSKAFTDFSYWTNSIRERYVREFGLGSALSYQRAKFELVRTYYHGPLVILYFPDDDPMFIDMLKRLRQEDDAMRLVALPAAVSRLPDSHPDPRGHAMIAETARSAVEALMEIRPASPSGR